MAQYESGQYINEFLNNMPTLLLTMRKMDVDQMLQTRRLDQQDTSLGLQRDRDIIDANKRGREAWRKVKEPLTQAMQQNLQLDEEYREQIKDMPWYQKAVRFEDEDFLGIESEQNRAKRLSEEKFGEPRKPSEIFGDVQSMSADLTPEQFMGIYSNPTFQPQMLGKTGLMGLTTAGLVGGQYP